MLQLCSRANFHFSCSLIVCDFTTLVSQYLGIQAGYHALIVTVSVMSLVNTAILRCHLRIKVSINIQL